MGLSKDFLYYQHSFYKDVNIKYIKKSFKAMIRTKKLQEKIIICFENLDRCDIDKKIAILSGVHNFKDWFDSPIFLIAIDPHSVDKQKKFFEDLVKKVFTTSLYIYQKTTINLEKYLYQQNIDIDCREILKKYIMSIYPITPRDINHIINIFDDKVGDKSNIEESAFMSILHSEWRDLHHKIAKNPFFVQFFIESVRKDISKNYYKDLKYGANDTKRLNQLFLEFSNSFDNKSDIYDKCNGISPLVRINEANKLLLQANTKIESLESILPIIHMQLEAGNYFEINRIIKKCESTTKDIESLFVKCFQYPDMVRVLFSTDDCMDIIDGVDFESSDKRHILSVSSKKLNSHQNKYLSSFILKIFQVESIKEFDKEFALLFSGNSQLFLSFYIELQNDTEKLGQFIYHTYSDELHSVILHLDIKTQINLYKYLMKFFSQDISIFEPNSKHFNINRKLLDRFLYDEIFLKSILKEDLLSDYYKIFDNTNMAWYSRHFRVIENIISQQNIFFGEKARIYYLHIKYLQDDKDDIIRNFIWILLDISKDEALIKKYHFIFEDSDLMSNKEFIKKYSNIIRNIILNLIENLSLSMIQNNIFNALSGYMFEYLIAEDFPILNSKFFENDFGIFIIKNNFKNTLYYDFIEYLANSHEYKKYFSSTDIEYLNHLGDGIVGLVNIKYNLDYIRLLHSKYLPKRLIEKLDFSTIDAKSLIMQYDNFANDEYFKFLLKIDDFILNDNKIELEKYLIIELESNNHIPLKSILTHARINFFADIRANEVKKFIINIFSFFEKNKDIFSVLVGELEPYMSKYNIDDAKTLRILQEYLK